MEFKKATKDQVKLRLAIFGPSGAGKTYSSLSIASGMEGRAAVIDTERLSAKRYADRFDFDVLDLEKREVDSYVAAIQLAAQAAYPILIIDSLSHGWKDLLQEIDRLAKTKYKGNTWAAWQEGTPKQNKLVDAILTYPGHVIATMRSKTEWTSERMPDGKVKPVRVGLQPEQGKGIEYEFDILIQMDVDNSAEVLKDRTGKFQGRVINKPGPNWGKELEAWLAEGVAPPENDPSVPTKKDFYYQGKRLGLEDEDLASIWQSTGGDAARAIRILVEQHRPPDEFLINDR
jgi:hypothetical protein